MYKLSKLAATDFASIYEYTLLNFGVRQDTKELEYVLGLLSESPLMGQEQTDIGAGVRRHDHQRHAIFYRNRQQDIFVLRILHQQMETTRHLFEQ